MTPTHANKGRRRYRYYVTRPDLLDGQSAWRVSAHDLEALVCTQLCQLLTDRSRMHDLVTRAGADTRAADQAFRTADAAATTLRSGAPAARAEALQQLIAGIALHEGRIEISVAFAGLLQLVRVEALDPVESENAIVLTCDAVKVRRGHELRLVIPGPNPAPAARVRDDTLVALFGEAHAARELVLASSHQSIARVAADAGRCRT